MQDGSNLDKNFHVKFYQVVTRIIIFSLLFGIYVLADKSAQAMEGEAEATLHNRYLTMLETVIYPMLVIAYLLNSGAYDLLV